MAEPGEPATVVRVLPDVPAIEKEFDYRLPAAARLAAGAVAVPVGVGSVVRVDLAGRRVGGWVLGARPGTGPGDAPVEVEGRAGRPVTLRTVAKVRGWGPEPALVDLAGWAAWRWAGRRAALLRTASPERAVPALPPPQLTPPLPPRRGGDLAALAADLPAAGTVNVQLPPAADPTPLVALLAQRGPTLVVSPSADRAAALADRLRRAGGGVALLPGDWARARAGSAVVVGARGAAWGPCPGLAAVVVLDAHDEGLAQEQAPTWHAAVVGVERARRVGGLCALVSAAPTLDLLAAGPVARLDRAAERDGWAGLEVVDRRQDDPRLGLYSERLVAAVRASRRVVCVLNRTGRARLLACRACGELARCEHCQAAVAEDPAAGTPRPLRCARCGTTRPPVCARCGSSALRHLRVGVSRVREELEALAGRPVAEVTAAAPARPAADVLVGTEAVLHRAPGADLVAFLDLDQELLAPRVRAAEEALAQLARSSRLVGGRRGRVLVQTRLPDHPVVRAALLADPGILAAAEAGTRRALRLPPFHAVAVVSGPSAAPYVAEVVAAAGGLVEAAGPDGDRWLLRAPGHAQLADALAGVPRPAGRLRVAVDPPRL